MWAIVAPYLIKLGISLAITLLERAGVISGVEAVGIKAGTHVIQVVENLHTEDSYPEIKNQNPKEK